MITLDKEGGVRADHAGGDFDYMPITRNLDLLGIIGQIIECAMP
jgi:hypothetical protein